MNPLYFSIQFLIIQTINQTDYLINQFFYDNSLSFVLKKSMSNKRMFVNTSVFKNKNSKLFTLIYTNE